MKTEKMVAQMLMIKPGEKVLFINTPEDYASVLGDLPESVILLEGPEPGMDTVQIFVTSRQELESHLPDLRSSLAAKGKTWVTYPKGTSGIPVDINRDSIREYAGTIGLTAVAMISVDETWSALRLKGA